MKKSKLKKKRFETDILKQKQAIGILTAEELQDAIDSGLTTEKLDEVPIGDPLLGLPLAPMWPLPRPLSNSRGHRAGTHR